jgi:hypothetical protein
VSQEIPPPIVVAIEIGDPALAARLAALLGNVPGLRLALSGEPASVAIVARDTQGISPTVDAELTPRELDVLALEPVVIKADYIRNDGCS